MTAIPLPATPAWPHRVSSNKAVSSVTHAQRAPYLEGQRNERLFSLGGRLRHAGLEIGEISAALSVVNQTRCTPPLPDEEVMQVAESLGRYPAKDRRAIKLLTVADLDDLPPFEWLVSGFLPARALSVICGPPESCKTFLALDVALRISRQGPVVYVAAEGTSKLKDRVASWVGEHGPHGETFRFVAEAVQLNDSRLVDDFINAVLPLGPVRLIVFDTLSRCTSGMNENEAGEMSTVVEHCDRIRLATGAAVLLIHHTNKAGREERGSSVLLGAADMMAITSKKDWLVTLRCRKMKDSEHFPDSRYQLVPSAGSAFLRPISLPKESSSRSKLMECLSVLAENFPDGASNKEWRLAAGIPEKTFTRYVSHLRDMNLVVNAGTAKRTLYRPTSSGMTVARDRKSETVSTLCN